MVFNKFLVKAAKRMITNRPFTIAVEGNIGSGKTTFLQHIEKQGNAEIIAEPIDTWRNCNGFNLLGLMYEDPKKWAFTFQSYVQLTMLQNHLKATTKPVKLMERSLFSARYCFVEIMKREGILEKPAFSVLDSWFKWITENQDVSVDLIVYLRTTPEVVYQRILNRNRLEEKKVPLEYIKTLHQAHEDWLYYKTFDNCPAPVYTIDADADLASIGHEFGKFETQILSKRIITV